jgi:hypothetical protein
MRSTVEHWTRDWTRGSRVSQPRDFNTTYMASTLALAQGFLRRNVRLDLMLGSKRKQRISTCFAISLHPTRATSSVNRFSSVTPCRGSLDLEAGMSVAKESYENRFHSSTRCAFPSNFRPGFPKFPGFPRGLDMMKALNQDYVL